MTWKKWGAGGSRRWELGFFFRLWRCSSAALYRMLVSLCLVSLCLVGIWVVRLRGIWGPFLPRNRCGRIEVALYNTPVALKELGLSRVDCDLYLSFVLP